MPNADTSPCHDYRVSHQAAEAGTDYAKTFETGYCAALWQKIEKPRLESKLYPFAGHERTSMDFACGTGRITRVAAMPFGAVVGIDVSEAMLMHASVPENVKVPGWLAENFIIVSRKR